MKKDWKIVKIPEVLLFQEGPGVRKHQFTSEGVKLLNVGNINDGQINLNKTKIYISEKEAYGKYKHFLVDDGDLVIASSGIVVSNFHNKIAFIKKDHLPLCMNTSTIRFKVINKKLIDINYFKYFLKTNYFSSQLRRLITGSAQLNFGPSHLKKIDLILPPLKDQKRIVKILDKADILRQKRKQAIGLLDDYLKSVFLKMFGDPVKNEKGWKVGKLGNMIDFMTSGSRGWAKYYSETGDIFLRIQNVRNNALKLDDLCFITSPDTAEAKRTKVRSGDVLLSITADLGRTAVIPENFGDAYISQHLALLRLKKDFIPDYVAEFLTSGGGIRQMNRLNKGGVKAGLNFNDIKSLQIPIPDIEVQKVYLNKKINVQKTKQLMLAQFAELETQFQALMQKAFSGKL